MVDPAVYAAAVVGSKGQVTAFNPPAYDRFEKAALAERYAPARLPNVVRLMTEFAAFAPETARYDAAFMIQNYHDVYFAAPPDWPPVDGRALLAHIRNALKPGGILGIVDHRASPGAGTSAAQTLHRIEQAALVADLTRGRLRARGRERGAQEHRR